LALLKVDSQDFRFIMTKVRVFLALSTFAASAFAKDHRKRPGTIVPWKDVPALIQATMQSNAGSGKVKEVQKETANGVVVYWAEVKETDGKWIKIYVNDSGTLLKSEPDNARNKRKHKPFFG